MNKDSEYLSEELDLNGGKEWFWGPFDEVRSPSDCAVITKNADGSFDARYEE